MPHPLIDISDIENQQTAARFFVKEAIDEHTGRPYVAYGKSRIELLQKQEDGTYKHRKVRLLYGIAFASYRTGKRERLDMGKLVTPIVPFYVSTVYIDGIRHWIFER